MCADNRNILFITTDQQRYDALGCNGGKVARTPVINGLAQAGVNYRRCYANNTLCQPARCTILTGVCPRSHGVFSNGMALPYDTPTVADLLSEAGYKTALIGKPHFDPGIDPERRFMEHQLPEEGSTGPYRGFDHVEFAWHSPRGVPGQLLGHYGKWLAESHPDHLDSFAPLLLNKPGGETGAPETHFNPIPIELYHTDWVAGRSVEWLRSLNDGDAWFLWVSFPDPHHPWDPPASERHRVDWRELTLPEAYLSPEHAATVLSNRPAHWLAYRQGRWLNAEGAPWGFRPSQLSKDNVREINAMVHIMNELIDEACGRVISEVQRRGWDTRTDILYTSDHGELQGDFGFIYKGPFHVDALMRLPLIWRPAPSANIDHSEVREPVQHTDLAPTFCAIAGISVPDWMDGSPLPTAPDPARQRAICTWDSQLSQYGMHFATIYRDGWLCTLYERSTKGVPTGIEEFFSKYGMGTGPVSSIEYEGGEGELYNVEDDPHQIDNRWDDPSLRSLRDDLVADLLDHLPSRREPALEVVSPT